MPAARRSAACASASVSHARSAMRAAASDTCAACTATARVACSARARARCRAAGGQPGGVGAGQRGTGAGGCRARFVVQRGLGGRGCGGRGLGCAQGRGQVAAGCVGLGGAQPGKVGRWHQPSRNASARAAKLSSMAVASSRAWVNMASIRGTMRRAASTAGSVPAR